MVAGSPGKFGACWRNQMEDKGFAGKSAPTCLCPSLKRVGAAALFNATAPLIDVRSISTPPGKKGLHFQVPKTSSVCRNSL